MGIDRTEFFRLFRLRDLKGLIAALSEKDEGLVMLLAGASAGMGWVEGLRLALDLGCDPNTREPVLGLYPLEEAVEFPELVDLLLEAGADPKLGIPIIKAVHAGVSAEVLEKLVAVGMDVNAHNEGFPGALDFALANERIDLVEVLEKRGATRFKDVGGSPSFG